VQEFARQQEEVDQVACELERNVKALSQAEAAFEAFLAGRESDAGSPEAAEEWARLAPLEVGDQVLLGDPKMRRTLQVSALADRVTTLQWQRDAASSELEAARRELEEARRRFEIEDQQHRGCTWNCSVKRAAPFYDRRRMHEHSVDAQLSKMKAVERQLQIAKQRVKDLRAKGSYTPLSAGRSRTARSLDEMSLHSFEIAGGEPGQDEFMSCASDTSDGDR